MADGCRAGSSAAVIQFESVTKSFPNGKAVLTDVSFTIESGDRVAFVGPSGAGKTTILRLIIGDLMPTSGTVTVDDINVSSIKERDLPKLRRSVGAVFQDYKLLSDRTVAENIGLVLEIANAADDVVTKRVSELLDLVHLTGRSNSFPRQLSGGELQRVAIARALANSPKIIFADEPTGNLDTDASAAIAKLLKSIHEAGTTVMVATHDSVVIKMFDGRLLHLNQGKLGGPQP